LRSTCAIGELEASVVLPLFMSVEPLPLAPMVDVSEAEDDALLFMSVLGVLLICVVELLLMSCAFVPESAGADVCATAMPPRARAAATLRVVRVLLVFMDDYSFVS
jgi:hypothetical protein